MSISNQKGDVGEAAFALAAAKRGYWTAKMPQDCPYDFVLDKKNGASPLRVQVKYRSMSSTGTVGVKIVQKHHSNRQTYNSQNIDLIAVYVPELDKVFLIPIQEVSNVDGVTLRCVPSKTNQSKTIRMIDLYENW